MATKIKMKKLSDLSNRKVLRLRGREKMKGQVMTNAQKKREGEEQMVQMEQKAREEREEWLRRLLDTQEAISRVYRWIIVILVLWFSGTGFVLSRFSYNDGYKRGVLDSEKTSYERRGQCHLLK